MTRRGALLLAAVATVTAAVGMTATPAMASNAIRITELPVGDPFQGPVVLTNAPDGNVWFSGGIAGYIGRMTPAGVVTKFPVPNSYFIFGITAGPDGNIWFCDELNQFIGRMNLSGQVTGEFPIAGHPDDFFPEGGPLPSLIRTGSDGALWFTEQDGNRIGRMTTSGQLTEYKLPVDPLADPNNNPGAMFPASISLGPDGNMWFLESRFGGGPHIGNKVGRITPAGVITEFPIPTQDSFPSDIEPGSDGNMWFTEEGADIFDPSSFPAVDKLSRITLSGAITEFQMPVNSNPSSVTAGADGNLWVTENTSANGLAKVSVNGVLLAQTSVPSPNAYPNSAIAGPDGRVWFAEPGVGKIGRTQVVGCTDHLSGRISSPLNVTSGALCLSGAQVKAPITVGPNASLFASGDQLMDGVSADGAGLVHLCGTMVKGSVNISGTTDEVEIGNPSDSCPGNALNGGATLTNNTSPVDVVASNRIIGNLGCTGNSPAPTNAGQPNFHGTRSGQCVGL